LKFACFQPVNARQDIGIPIYRVNAVALCGSNERQMYCNCFCALIGASEEAIFAYEYPRFYCPFGLVVVYCNVGIFEKSGQCYPVLQSVIDGFHQFMSWIELSFGADDEFSKVLHEWFRFFSPNCQAKVSGFVLYFSFDIVEFLVHIEDGIANILFSEFRFKILASGMGAAASFDSLPIGKQSIEPTSSICLNYSFKVFEKGKIFFKRKVRREVKHIYRMSRVADVGSYFPFLDIIFVSVVLNFNRRVISFDDGGCEQLLFQHIVQERECVCCGLHPVALRRAWNGDIAAVKYFCLPIIRKTVIEFTDNDFSEKSRSGVASGNGGARFFSGNDVLFASRAGASFLEMFDNFQAGANHFELMGKSVADENRIDEAAGAGNELRLYRMYNRFVWKIFGIFNNVFYTDIVGVIGYSKRLPGFGLICSRTGIVLLSFFSVVLLVTLFRLSDQNVELSLQVFEQLAEFFIAVESLLQLSLQVSVLSNEALNFSI